MSAKTLRRRGRPDSPPVTAPTEDDGLRAAARRHLERTRRMKLNVGAWALGSSLLTAAWIAHEWQANGAFERFGHEGNPGDWNPTLWALAVLVWGLVVGIMALRVSFERPATAEEVDREVRRMKPHADVGNLSTEAGLRALARGRLERLGRLRFHVAVWLLGLIALTPVNVLIEWQDNGGFERLSRDSQPGSWDPWALVAGGIWALVVVVVYARPVLLDRRKERAELEGDVTRARPSH